MSRKLFRQQKLQEFGRLCIFTNGKDIVEISSKSQFSYSVDQSNPELAT